MSVIECLLKAATRRFNIACIAKLFQA